MPKILTLLLVLICFSGTSLPAQTLLKDRIREKISERRGEGKIPASLISAGAVEMSYGSHALQKLDFWKSSTPGAPLVIYVHGGGWKRGDKLGATGTKDEHYVDQGYAFASINYRLVPTNTVEEQAQDVADAVAYLVKKGGELGFDGNRVALMGHSAGAHLVALVGTDLGYLEKAGLSGNALRGIIPLDGAIRI